MDENDDDRTAGQVTPAPTGESVQSGPSAMERLLEEGDAVGAGREASRFVAGLRNAKPYLHRESRFRGAVRSKYDDVLPLDAGEFYRLPRGMRWLEWRAGELAKEEAIRAEREMWLPHLEDWLANLERDFEGEDVPILRQRLTHEIKRLRHCLGIVQSPEERRERTRLRVRALRARKAVRQ
jgi:hypothetical protein